MPACGKTAVLSGRCAVKIRRVVNPEDTIGLVGLGLILAGVLLLILAGIAARDVSNPYQQHPLKSLALGPKSAE